MGFKEIGVFFELTQRAPCTLKVQALTSECQLLPSEILLTLNLEALCF